MLQFIKEIGMDIMTLRTFPCHRKRERSLIIKGKQFPVCFRCMFMLIGLFMVIPIVFFHFFPPLSVGVMICVGFNIPLLIDGITQAKGLRESHNVLRSITGFLSGVGLAVFISSTSFVIVSFIIKSI